MKLPSFEQAAAAIDALARLTPAGQSIAAAADLVNIVTDLFGDTPDRRDLKARYAQARRDTDAAFDRLDKAIADVERRD